VTVLSHTWHLETLASQQLQQACCCSWFGILFVSRLTNCMSLLNRRCNLPGTIWQAFTCIARCEAVLVSQLFDSGYEVHQMRSKVEKNGLTAVRFL